MSQNGGSGDLYPGLGARAVDSHCIRCGQEADQAHRDCKNMRNCQGDCFLCHSQAHLGLVCPTLVAQIGREWFRQRGFTGKVPGLPKNAPEMPTLPYAALPSLPPAAPKPKEDIQAAKSNASIDAAHTLGAAAKMVFSAVGSLLLNASETAAGPYIHEHSSQLTAMASNLTTSADQILKRLQEAFPESIPQATNTDQGVRRHVINTQNMVPSTTFKESSPVNPSESPREPVPNAVTRRAHRGRRGRKHRIKKEPEAEGLRDFSEQPEKLTMWCSKQDEATGELVMSQEHLKLTSNQDTPNLQYQGIARETEEDRDSKERGLTADEIVAAMSEERGQTISEMIDELIEEQIILARRKEQEKAKRLLSAQCTPDERKWIPGTGEMNECDAGSSTERRQMPEDDQAIDIVRQSILNLRGASQKRTQKVAGPWTSPKRSKLAGSADPSYGRLTPPAKEYSKEGEIAE